ncbi:2'-5' RNA ligase family protein [Komagataeibacter rhaeticus]|nr:2'-5' RNA ligase family protein [Komagataeibacter rhaeticus]
MRLFIGLELPPSISLALADLRGSLPDVAWTAPESWHLTLHFIGEVTQPHQLEEIHHALCAIHAAPPCWNWPPPACSKPMAVPPGTCCGLAAYRIPPFCTCAAGCAR